jgi:ribosome biogenesis GTPase
VVRHDGTALHLATTDGVTVMPMTRRLDPAPTVGDWMACVGNEPVAVLPRASLLVRAGRDGDQSLAANVDLVLLVCGLDRPVKAGRISRGAALARDAGAIPVVVLTKAALDPTADLVREKVVTGQPGIEVLVTSAKEGLGLDALRDLARDQTVTMLGESGAGKSSLVNALMGEEVAATSAVRRGDSKGVHTTTSRELHVLPTGGILIDTPGIRSVGLSAAPEAVTEAFAEIDARASECRFADCRHDQEPGCAVTAGLVAGEIAPERLAAWRVLRAEAEAAELRTSPYEQRRRDKQFARVAKSAAKRKGR